MTDVDESETSSLAWVNKLFKAIWPNTMLALVKFVNAELTSKLQRDLPVPFKSARFSRFSLGEGVPSLGPIDVMKRSDDHISVELDLSYSSVVDILLSAGPESINIGIKYISFAGRLCVELQPVLDTWPVVGALILAFAGQPKLEIKFSGIADAPLPGLAKRVQATVDAALANLVLPNCSRIPLASDDRLLNLAACSRAPIGVLKVQVRKGINLAGANWRMGSVRNFTSNPYCVLQVGSVTARTSTVKATTNPDWNDAPCFFIVYHKDQELLLEIIDDDAEGFLQRNFVGLLGRLRITVREALLQRSDRAGCCRFVLDTSQVKSGLLHVDDPVNTGVPSEVDVAVAWMDISPAAPSKTLLVKDLASRGHIGIMLVQLHSGTGFPEECAHGKIDLKWKCALAGSDFGDFTSCSYSAKGKLQVQAPNFHLPIPQCLYHVIDELTARGAAVMDIADIIQFDHAQVTEYLEVKSKFYTHMSARQLETGKDHCVELVWNETVALLVQEPAHTFVSVSLMDGSKLIGSLEQISVQDVLSRGGEQLKICDLSLAVPDHRRQAAGRLSSWMFPACTSPIPGNRFEAVRMSVSVRYVSLAQER
mmetsp:Transcript_785/g.2158  ORF Transcript_785/g.2158 Transcript_785/m.2158 type:complete len:594 (-) Transcript_785:114-1895(-)